MARTTFQGFVIRMRQDAAGVWHARVTTRTAEGRRRTHGATWATKQRHALRSARALVRQLNQAA